MFNEFESGKAGDACKAQIFESVKAEIGKRRRILVTKLDQIFNETFQFSELTVKWKTSVKINGMQNLKTFWSLIEVKIDENESHD